MAKEESKTPSAPQAPATVERSAAETQITLDSAASFQALVASGKDSLAKIKDGWAKVLEGIAECEKLQQAQKSAFRAAREFAEKNGTISTAVEQGHNPLVAHSWENVSTLPAPAVDVPAAYVTHFPSADHRHTATQALLNGGSTLVTPHNDKVAINAALLAGVHPADIQTARVPLDELNKTAAGWFGLKPSK